VLRGVALSIVLLGFALPAHAENVLLLRLFLVDGTPLVSYGEFARVDSHVVFSMPVGGTPTEPRLHLVSLPETAVDWPRTDRYVASARYQHYGATRGEDDYAALSNDVARALSDIALSTDPTRALSIATAARARLAAWPPAHFGYRQRDVNEIVTLLDDAIASLRGRAGVNAFDVSVAANAPEVPLEPMLDMPGVRESLDALLAVARVTDRSADRELLLQSALAMLEQGSVLIPRAEADPLRASIQRQISEERATDERYARLSRRLITDAQHAAAGMRIRDVEAALASVPNEDRRLGGRRPEVVIALQTSLQATLDAARKLRLLRDQWVLRRGIYRGYQNDVGSQIVRLVKAQPALDAIRRFEGPAPSSLDSLGNRLAGSAQQLERMMPPTDLRGVHDLLIGASRFAEQAVQNRRAAVLSGNVDTARSASSAAAAALMLLSRAQQELRTFVEPPHLR
jgi:hypothetical protein